MCTVTLQKKVWRVLLEFLKYLPSRLFLLLCSPRLIFFQCSFVLSTRFVLENWKVLLIRVSISLIVEVHGVNGVGEGDVIWMEPILFVSVTDSFLSLNVLKLYNQCPERSGISTICSKSVFRKAIENIRKMYRTSVPATRNFVLFFFCFDDVQTLFSANVTHATRNFVLLFFCFLSANVIQCNVFISENERRTGFDVNTSRENYLVASFHMVHLINQKHI